MNHDSCLRGGISLLEEGIVDGFLRHALLWPTGQEVQSSHYSIAKLELHPVGDGNRSDQHLISIFHRQCRGDVNGGHQMTLGIKSNFPAMAQAQPLLRRCIKNGSSLSQQQHPGIRISYDAVGSGLGMQLFSENKVDFAASDVPQPDQGPSQSGAGFRRIASVLGGVVPIYNLKGLTQNLKFTPEALAGIYLGKIKKWNDPIIKGVNKSARLPDADIVVVHRSDGSGTTYAWSDYLSKINADWKTTVGVGISLKWPVGTGVERNEGVAATVQKTPNSIGYVELVYSARSKPGPAGADRAPGG